MTLAISGVGLLSPFGFGTEAAFDGLVAGESRVGPVTRLAGAFGSLPPVGGTIPPFEDARYVGRRGKFVDRYCRLALAAAHEALADAGVEPAVVEPARVAVVIGSALAAIDSTCTFIGTFYRHGFGALSPAEVPNTILNTAASQVTIRLGLEGGATSVASAGLAPLRLAADLLRDGDVDVVIAGSVEELTAPGIRGCAAAGLLTPAAAEPARACRPFDRSRSGTVVGEAACLFVLERPADVRRRAGRIRALLGEPALGFVPEAYGANDGGARGAGALQAVVGAALTRAGTDAAGLACLLPGGNGTARDALEAAALAGLPAGIPAAAIRGATGDAFGASAAMQVAVAMLALERGIVPATPGFETPDPVCPMTGLAPVARRCTGAAALVTTVPWDGEAGAVVVRAAPDGITGTGGEP
jgi:3-oxoacyl-[acyl-carrier-protein] synthase II